MIDLSSIEQRMSARVLEKGATPEGLYWANGEMMEKQFIQLAQVFPREIELFSVNDLGCGYGAFLDWMRNRGFILSWYAGYDISAAMINLARLRARDDDHLSMFYMDARLSHALDYSVGSGLFNLIPDGISEQQWLEHMRATILNLAKHSRKGFAFNALTTYVDYRTPGLYYADPLYFFDWCKRVISRRVTLLHDDGSWTWTIYVRF